MTKVSKNIQKNKLFFYFIFFLLPVLVGFNIWGLGRLKDLKRAPVEQFPPVFFPSPTPTSALSEVSLVVVGDVMLARSVTTKMRFLNDFSYPFQKTASILKEADVALINLESPFGSACASNDGGMKFCADFRSVEGLIAAGVDIASLANNHALDQGEDGLAETELLLEENFIHALGLREPVFLEINGVSLVFLAYNEISPKSLLVSWAYPDVVESEIKRFSSEADVLVVYFHWGKEYAETPQVGSGSSVDPKKLAHLAVDAGADLVLGAHPHVVWENEWYKEKLIVYSLGNFIFDQEWSEETQKGMVGRFILSKNGLVESEFLPVQIVDYQPVFTNPS